MMRHTTMSCRAPAKHISSRTESESLSSNENKCFSRWSYDGELQRTHSPSNTKATGTTSKRPLWPLLGTNLQNNNPLQLLTCPSQVATGQCHILKEECKYLRLNNNLFSGTMTKTKFSTASLALTTTGQQLHYNDHLRPMCIAGKINFFFISKTFLMGLAGTPTRDQSHKPQLFLTWESIISAKAAT